MKVMMVKLKEKPVDMYTVQMYMPTSQQEDEKVEEMYAKVEQILDQHIKGKHYCHDDRCIIDLFIVNEQTVTPGEFSSELIYSTMREIPVTLNDGGLSFSSND